MDALYYSMTKTIYNAKYKHKANEYDRHSQMQQKMHKLMELNYVEWLWWDKQNNCIRDLTFAHPTSIDILLTLPIVSIMDCISKMKRYWMSLLDIIGVISTNKTFTITFVYKCII